MLPPCNLLFLLLLLLPPSSPFPPTAPPRPSLSLKQPTTALHVTPRQIATAGLTTGALATGALQFFNRASRPYKATESANSVATEYDAWTADGVLEYYWGHHIHLGYYNEEVSGRRKEGRGAENISGRTTRLPSATNGDRVC